MGIALPDLVIAVHLDTEILGGDGVVWTHGNGIAAMKYKVSDRIEAVCRDVSSGLARAIGSW